MLRLCAAMSKYNIKIFLDARNQQQDSFCARNVSTESRLPHLDIPLHQTSQASALLLPKLIPLAVAELETREHEAQEQQCQAYGI